MLKVDASTNAYLVHRYLARAKYVKFDEIDNKKVKYKKEFYQIQWNNIKRDLGKSFVYPNLIPRLTYSFGALALAFLQDLPLEFAAGATLAYDSASSNTDMNLGVDTLSVTHTASGSNRAVFVMSAWRDFANNNAKSVTATYNSVSMTEVDNQVFSGDNTDGLWVFKLSNPASGAVTASVIAGAQLMTDSTWEYPAIGVVSFTGAHQTTASLTGTVTKSAGTGANPSISVTSAVGEIVLNAFASYGGPSDDASCDQTERVLVKTYINDTGNAADRRMTSGMQTATGAASVNMSFTKTDSTNGHCTIGFSVVPGADTTNGQFLQFMGPQPQV